MANEQNYKSYLLTFQEAMDNLWGREKLVLAYVWDVFVGTENALKGDSQPSGPPPPPTTDSSTSQGMSFLYPYPGVVR